MNYQIRNFTLSDYEMVASWWKEVKEIPPSISMLPEETTFIMEIDNTPAFCLSIYFTNCKEYSYLGNFISNTNYKNKERKIASEILMNTVLNYAKNLGYKNVICLTNVSKLQKRYEEMGFKNTISNVKTFSMRIA